MTLLRAAAALALAAALARPALAPAAPSKAPAEAPAAGPSLPEDALEGLTPEQRQVLEGWAKSTFCYCGCPHTVLQCAKGHTGCRHGARMVTLAARLVRAGAKKDELARLVDGYYASFDRRAKLDVSKFGPALGSADAPVTIVEFSDFTCPYCQLVRPALERFVEARQGRVKLVYKPFPIETHPGALELAQAGEWARDQNLFWPMHDALFASPGSHTPEELSAIAHDLGGDASSLVAALGDGRYLPKVRASQAEARAAGIKGTPTLFLNGRMLVLMDYSDEGLEFTLQDEEEWVKHGGWDRD
jgi:protein-disulfide isomerase